VLAVCCVCCGSCRLLCWEGGYPVGVSISSSCPNQPPMWCSGINHNEFGVTPEGVAYIYIIYIHIYIYLYLFIYLSPVTGKGGGNPRLTHTGINHKEFGVTSEGVAVRVQGQPEPGLHKIFVCLFGDCALVNLILGIQQLLYCPPPPPLYFAINIAQYMVSARPPCFSIQHTILVTTISCKGQTEPLVDPHRNQPQGVRCHL